MQNAERRIVADNDGDDLLVVAFRIGGRVFEFFHDPQRHDRLICLVKQCNQDYTQELYNNILSK